MEISYKDKIFDTGRDIEIRYRTDAGIWEFTDRIVNVVRERGIIPASIGFVTKNFPFISNLNVIDNIRLPLEYHGTLKPGPALERIFYYIKELGIENIIRERREDIGNSELLRAMFARAASMDPEAVFFYDVRHFVPLVEFADMLHVFREITRHKIKMWIGLGEGLNLKWKHDVKIRLDD